MITLPSPDRDVRKPRRNAQPARLRATAGVMLCAYLGVIGTHCATISEITSSYDSVEAAGPEIPPAPADFRPIRIVLLDFRNAAAVSRFDVIPDGNYGDFVANPQTPIAENPEADAAGTIEQSDDSDTSAAVDEPVDASGEGEGDAQVVDEAPGADDAEVAEPDSEAEPEVLDSGDLAREITETTLFQSGRFEIVPEFRFRAAMDAARNAGADSATAIQQAAAETGVEYIVYGALTDFEIRQQRQLWKLPLWAIVLVGSFFIKDDDLRIFVWYTMLRLALIVPLNSPAWNYGIEWDDLDLNVDIGMDLRLVNARTGSVAYSDARAVTRVENVRNLNLLVWSSNRRLKITRSNAGRQMRYVARELVRELSLQTDAGLIPTTASNQKGPPLAQPENVN